MRIENEEVDDTNALLKKTMKAHMSWHSIKGKQEATTFAQAYLVEMKKCKPCHSIWSLPIGLFKTNDHLSFLLETPSLHCLKNENISLY